MYFVGIDVGTGSVRAALVSHAGEIFCTGFTSATDLDI